jgi:hypothetical protein
MVKAPLPKGSNSAARRLASSKSATAVASAAVSAASAAAALVPFEMGLGCMPAKGDLKNIFDRMARHVAIFDGYASLATAAALPQLKGASTRLTTAATCAAKRGPANRAHSAHSPTLKVLMSSQRGLSDCD